MRRVTEWIKTRCLNGAGTVKDAVEAGADVREVAECVLRALTIAPVVYARQLLREAVRAAAPLGLREYLGVATVGFEAPLIVARYVDTRGNAIASWDGYRERAVSFAEDMEVRRVLHEAPYVRDEIALVYNGRDVLVPLNCISYADWYTIVFHGYAVEVNAPPDANPDVSMIRASGIICAGSYAETQSGLPIGVGVLRGRFDLPGLPGVVGEGVAVYINDADGGAEKACWRGYCVQKERGRKIHIIVVDADAFQLRAWKYL